MDPIEPATDFRAELGAVALKMRQMSLDCGKSDALLALFRPHLGHVGTDGTQELDDEIFGFHRHGMNLRWPIRDVKSMASMSAPPQNRLI